MRQGDGRAGFAKHEPYDRIIVTASADQLRSAWLEQLAEGGRIIVPLRLDPDADAIQLIPVFERRGQRLRSLETISGGFMPLHGGDGGWRSPPASLTAARHRPGRHSQYASISGAPVARLSDAAGRRLLAAVIGPPSTRSQGRSAVARGHTPLILIYLLITIPHVRRVWVRRGRWHGIGIVGRDGRGLAVVSIPSVWDRNPDPNVARGRWRMQSYGESDEPRAELERLLDRWRALERLGPHEPEITARPAGEEMRRAFGGVRSVPDSSLGEELLDSLGRDQPDHSGGVQSLRPLPAAAEMGAKRPDEQRVTREDERRQRLRVVVPQPLAAPPPPPASPNEAREPDPDRQIKPHDRVRRARHEVADLVLVGAVDHPAVGGEDRLELGAQRVIGLLGPPRPVDERVELDERQLEDPRQLAAERRLAVPARAGDHRDPAQRRLPDGRAGPVSTRNHAVDDD